MTSLTQITLKKLSKEQLENLADAADGEFDAALGLPPRDMNLGSPYFKAYAKEVLRTGKTPF